MLYCLGRSVWPQLERDLAKSGGDLDCRHYYRCNRAFFGRAFAVIDAFWQGRAGLQLAAFNTLATSAKQGRCIRRRRTAAQHCAIGLN